MPAYLSLGKDSRTANLYALYLFHARQDLYIPAFITPDNVYSRPAHVSIPAISLLQAEVFSTGKRLHARHLYHTGTFFPHRHFLLIPALFTIPALLPYRHFDDLSFRPGKLFQHRQV